MEIVVPPPAAVRAFLLGLPLAVALVGLALRGRPLVHRLAPAVVVALVCGAISALALRPMRFGWDGQGIRDATFGPDRLVPWSQVRDARVVRGFWRSGTAPACRTHGVSYAGNGSGTWRASNGESLRVFFLPGSTDAVLLTANGERCLYAPVPFDRFLEALRAGGVSVAGP